jgi:hypothetical protein
MDIDDLEHRFNYHPPKAASVAEAHQEMRAAMLHAALSVEGAVPDSREKSLALTKLEEAMFWSNAGIARIRNYEE